MDLPTYLADRKTSQAAFARLLGVSQGLVYQWIKGHRPISPERCVEIEKATGGAVARPDLRPDDWHLIWPELVHQKEVA
ncbi:transcriptional regulator [Burkholderia territorii]|uniref:transcriptional regulator n=1 Tax=Burkholderia territorii TaxID=1503055 RepID=UPI00075C30C4|nr:helix-turn-helix domain-containing protein [Burkholderia territorii]KWO62587.1 hypothetical protein WT98_30440 [Burkholderia territorii]